MPLFLTLKAVGELQFFEHIVCWVLSNHSIIDCHLKDLVEYIMDIIYRGNLQNFAVSKGVVELPHIRLFTWTSRFFPKDGFTNSSYI